MDKAAQQLFTVLGELKGGAMKVGQALSVMEAAIPEQYGKPYREALTKLQRDAPPLPAAKVHRVLDAQLGTKWRERFASFDDTPVASASIGQVHKAVWSDGREVAVKIQYPGADEALRADLKTMQRMVSVLKQLSPGADVQGVVDELIERTEMELDYRLEADNQRAFAKAYEGHPHFVVPHIVASAPKVVIAGVDRGHPDVADHPRGHAGTARSDGHPALRAHLRRAAAARDDARRRASRAISCCCPTTRWASSTSARWRRCRAEFRSNSASRRATHWRRTTTTCCPPWRRSASSRRASRCRLREIDDMLRQYVEPLEVEVFHYTRKWLQKMTAVNMDRSVAQIRTARQMDIPAKLAIPMRVIASNVAISCQLDAHIPTKALATELIPGFAEEAA